MKVITVKLIVEDACNPSNDEALRHVTELICEAFGKEERQEHPRCKLILMDVKHGA
jgi:hypothetical protein